MSIILRRRRDYIGGVKLPNTPHDYSQDYFTIVSLEDNNAVSFVASSSSLTKTISVSTDNGQSWADKTSTTSGTTIATLNTGDKVLIKGSNNAYADGNYSNYFSSTRTFDVEGNIMSLKYGDNFIGQKTIIDYSFCNLFRLCKVVDAGNLILPSTTLTYYCYYSMFYNCTSLTAAPALPATTLSEYCYTRMFYGCASLTTAPILPATELKMHCYAYMFHSCTSLTTAPELPATTVNQSCYEYMFYGCTSLTTSPVLAAATLLSDCYNSMFTLCTSLNKVTMLATKASASNCLNGWLYGVSATGIFIKNSAMTTLPTGWDGIPSGWTVENA